MACMFRAIENVVKDAQKGQTSHPPDSGGYLTRQPGGCQDSLFTQGRAFSHAAFLHRSDPQRGPVRLTDSAARTDLALLIRRTVRPGPQFCGSGVGQRQRAGVVESSNRTTEYMRETLANPAAPSLRG